MQKRHFNRRQYFEELAMTSREYYLDICPGQRILEVGCGEGGNLLPFAERGCSVTGIDLSEGRIREAQLFFEEHGQSGRFIAMNFLEWQTEEKFDVVLCHDVIEHIEPPYKQAFLEKIRDLKTPNGLAFFGFPAWNMPFGGHQQICKGFVSHIPFIHLLPRFLYKVLLKYSGNDEPKIEEMMSIRRSQVTSELFEKLARQAGFTIHNRQLWFINPHYKQKFGLRPRRLSYWLSCIPYVRNYFSTACFYLLR